MADADRTGSTGSGKVSEGIDKAKERLHEEKRAAEDLAHEAQDTVSGLGARAKSALDQQGAEVRDEAVSHIRAFADAVRSAGDELARKEPGVASDVVREAARGLERFAESLEHKTMRDFVSDVRGFGQRHPGVFLAGSMFAGFAIARFATSAGAQRQAYQTAESYGREARDRSRQYGDAASARAQDYAAEAQERLRGEGAGSSAGGGSSGGAGVGGPGSGAYGGGSTAFRPGGGAAGAGVSGGLSGGGSPSGSPSGASGGVSGGGSGGVSSGAPGGSASAGVAGTGAAHPNAPGAGGASYGSGVSTGPDDAAKTGDRK
jgi:hypothetical protein